MREANLIAETYGSWKCGSLKALVRKLQKWDVPRNTKTKVILSDDSVIYLSAHWIIFMKRISFETAKIAVRKGYSTC